MKLAKLFAVGLSLFPYGSHASWATLDTLNSTDLTASKAFALACSPTGVSLAGGSVSPRSANGVEKWIVRGSQDSGASWTTVDDYGLQPTNPYLNYFTRVTSLASHPSAQAEANFYAAAGFVQVNPQTCVAIVRLSAGGTHSWKTVDEVRPTANALCLKPTSVAFNTQGVLWVLSTENPGKLSSRLILRKTTDLGKTWNTVFAYRHHNQPTSSASLSIHAETGKVVISGMASGMGFTLVSNTSDVRDLALLDDFQGAGPQGVVNYLSVMSPEGTLYSTGCAMSDDQNTYAFTRVYLPVERKWTATNAGSAKSCNYDLAVNGRVVVTTGETDGSWTSDLSIDAGANFVTTDLTKPKAQGLAACILPSGMLMTAGNALNQTSIWGVRGSKL